MMLKRARLGGKPSELEAAEDEQPPSKKVCADDEKAQDPKPPSLEDSE